MNDLRSHIAKAIKEICVEEGYRTSPVPGVHCMKISQTSPRSKRHWHRCFGIVAQGCKEIVLEHDVFRCDETHYTATPVDLPVISRIASASADKPFLCLLIDLDPLVLSEIVAQIEKDAPVESGATAHAMFVGKTTQKMLEATVRLVELFKSPIDAPVLGPLIVRELFYHLLRGPEGLAIRQFVRSGSKTHKISQAIFRLQSELTSDVDVPLLAKAANMSRSAFFKHFKEMTGMSPIQYQKRFRLIEARRLMIEEGESAERSAFKVGYGSASQFSREYSRMFGASPLRDAAKNKKNASSLQAI